MTPRPVEGLWSTPTEDLVGAPVIPGVWVTSLPFPTPLRFSFSYLLETAGGLLVVDLGWDTDESWQRFTAGLTQAGKTLDDITGVVVTHVHPDHYGLAGRIRDTTTAWIAVHPGEHPQLAPDRAAALERIDDMARWLRRCGCPEGEIDRLRGETEGLVAAFPSVRPDLDLVDGAPLPGTDGGFLVPVHTPGHTPGSTCFHDRERGVVFTGDHVLPRITPNVSKRPTSDEDPLSDYTASLRRLHTMDAGGGLGALPGHEWGFGGLGARAAEIEQHHGERLTEIEAAVTGASTVWEVSSAVSWSRPFDHLSARARRSAIGETHSHLHRLQVTGAVVMSPGSPERWAPATGQASPTGQVLQHTTQGGSADER